VTDLPKPTPLPPPDPNRNDKGQWKPGVSGNPETMVKPGQVLGPRGGPRLTTILLQTLEREARLKGQPVVTEDGRHMTWAEFFVERQLVKGCLGNARASLEIWSRVDGIVKQVFALEGTGGPPISVEDARKELASALAAISAPAPRTRRKKQAPQDPSA
jgi:hypothetical protein